MDLIYQQSLAFDAKFPYYKWSDRFSVTLNLIFGTDLARGNFIIGRFIYKAVRSFEMTVSKKLLPLGDYQFLYLTPTTNSEVCKDQDYCHICLHGDDVAMLLNLPCKHVYHYDCIATWFQFKMNCPYCRKKVLYSIRMTEPKVIQKYMLTIPIIYSLLKM